VRVPDKKNAQASLRILWLKDASAGAVRGVNPAEAFAKGGDSDEH
jgi:hypothetical protein